MERVLRATTTTTTTMDGSECRTISRFQRSSWSSPNDEFDSEYNDENTWSLAFWTSSIVQHNQTNNFQYECDVYCYFYSIDNVFKCLEQTVNIFHKHKTSDDNLE